MNNNVNNDNNAITLSDIIRVIWKNVILICCVTVAVTVACIVYVFGFVKPTYKATSDVLVAVSSSSTTTDTVDYTNTLRVVSTVGNEMVTSDFVVKKVAQKEGNGFDVSTEEKLNAAIKKIRANTKTSVSTTSYVVSITYIDENEKRAVSIANDLANYLTEYVDSDTTVQVFKLNVSTMNEAKEASYNAPNKKLYVIVAFLGGLVLSLVVVFIKEFMSNKFKTKDEVEYILKKDVIGVLPDSGKTNDELVPAPKTIHEFEPYNRLLSAIEYYNIENPYKSIMFTSTGEDELKSTTIFKMAHTLVNNEKKVVVVDLDIRKPVMHRYFNVQKKNGLVDYFKGDSKLEDIVKHADCGVDVITAGENIMNPIILLKNAKLKDFIDELKKTYDFVLVDTPPAAGLADSALISSYVDGVVYNVAINQTNKKVAKETVKSLETAGANIIGINITKAKFGRVDYYYRYYNYGETKEEKKVSE